MKEREVTAQHDAGAWKRAACFVDLLSVPLESRFDDMAKAEVKTERLRARGLVCHVLREERGLDYEEVALSGSV